MTFKDDFLELCERYDVVFDVTDRKELVFHSMCYVDGNPRISESVVIESDENAEYCEFVVHKIKKGS